MIGLFLENGPLGLSPTTYKLIQRNYSWHLNHNLIYIDNPVGSGFSFTESDGGYAKNGIDVGQHLLNALHQFFLLFPNLQRNEFYISGESYAGKYVPAIGYAIHQDNKCREDDQRISYDGKKKPRINLKGLTIGNGFIDPVHQLNYGDYLYQLGLIDTNGRRAFIKYENQAIDCIKKRDFQCAFDAFEKTMFGPNSLFNILSGFNNNMNFLKVDSDCGPLEDFLQNSKDIRRAIHVGKDSFYALWRGKRIIYHLKLDFMESVAHWVAELLEHYRILIYNGQLDIISAYPLMVNFLKHLNFSGAEEYSRATRYVWRADNDIAGYVKSGGNLTEVLVRNAGKHTQFQPTNEVVNTISNK